MSDFDTYRYDVYMYERLFAARFQDVRDEIR
jgi:hypothetical protein